MNDTRRQILQALEQASGRLVSGGELAEKLGLSRTAVWKQISALQQEGYHIRSEAGKGYRLERSEVFSSYEVEKRLEAGKVVVLVIDVHGAANIRRMFPGATTVFLLPPSVEELEHRLRGRGTETEESIQERLATARQELAEQDKFTVKLVNNQIEPCAAELYQVICQRAGLQG